MRSTLELYGAGWPLVPIRAGEKAPRDRNWQHTTYTLDDFNPEDNLGLKLGTQFIDIEIDADDDPAEIEAIVELEKFFEGTGVPLQPTWQSRKGPHYLFKIPHGLPASFSSHSGVKTVGDIEFRVGNAAGSLQSLIPPSRTQDFTRVWLNDPLKVPELSVEALDRVLGLFVKDERYEFLDLADPEIPFGRIGDDYNRDADWEDILTEHGWTVRSRYHDKIEWTRPGKHPRDGVSATTGYCNSPLRGPLFYSFSTADEVSPLPTGQAISKFEAYKLLNGCSDFREAAAKLGRIKDNIEPGSSPSPDMVEDHIPVEEPPDDTRLGLRCEDLMFPGFVARFAEWHSARMDEESLYYGAVYGILFQSWLMGRKTRLGRSRSNITAILFGPSGSGKTSGVNSMQDLLDEIGKTDSLYTGGAASGQGLMDSLTLDPHQIFVNEEASDLFRTMGSQGNEHANSINTAIKNVATAGKSLAQRVRARAKGELVKPPPIMLPHLSTVFTGVEDLSWRSLPPEATTDGFLHRCFTFSVYEEGDMNPDVREDRGLLSWMADHATRWIECKGEKWTEAEIAARPITTGTTEIPPKCHEIRRAPAAEQVFQEYRRKWHTTRKETDDEMAKGAWARAGELCAKLELVQLGSLAVYGDDPDAILVTEEQTHRAARIVEEIIRYKLKQMEGKNYDMDVQEQREETRTQLVLKRILNEGPWVYWKLAQSFKSKASPMRAPAVRAAVQELEELGLVVVHQLHQVSKDGHVSQKKTPVYTKPGAPVPEKDNSGTRLTAHRDVNQTNLS